MFAALSLSGGKRTCQNKQPRTITQRTEQDAGDLYFNPGHPGVDMPHYHFVIWHVPKKEEERVAK
jgi:hypothetical protein